MGSSANLNGGVPPGFRFHPTDEELLQYYLKKKVSFQKFDMDVIREVDLNKMEPWELQERCKIGSTPQNEWYFFSHKDRKYPTGSRTNRATNAGFWKATGRDKCIRSTYKKIGMRKTLVFYKGRAPHGQKTDWIMHEYRLEDGDDIQPNHNEDGWVICRVFKKKNLFKIGNGGGGSTTSIDSGHQPGNNTGISIRNHNQASRTNYINMDTHNYYDLLDQPAFELNKPVDLALHYSGHVVPSQAQSLSMVPPGGGATTSNNINICTRDQTDGATMAMGINYGWAMSMAPAPHHHHHEQNQHDPSKGMSFQIEEGDPSAHPVPPQMTNQLSPRGEMDFWGYTAAK